MTGFVHWVWKYTDDSPAYEGVGSGGAGTKSFRCTCDFRVMIGRGTSPLAVFDDVVDAMINVPGEEVLCT